MRYFFHLSLKCGDSREHKLMPIFLHFDDHKWFSEHLFAILDEICDIFVENLETIEKRSKGVDGMANSPPTRLHSTRGKIAVAFCTLPRHQYANYSILSMGSTCETQPRVLGIFPYEVIAWIFAIDPNNPYLPLPVECS